VARKPNAGALPLGQMVVISFPDCVWNPTLETLVRRHKVGGVIFFRENVPGSLAELKKFNSRIKRESLRSSGVLPFISVDEEGGRVSRLKKLIGEFPAPMDLAKKGLGAVTKNYSSLGRKVRAAGFNLTWAPVLDVDSNPKNPVIGDRSFSSDPSEAAKCGCAAITALRGAGLFTSGKHFPGHGDTSADSHLELPVVDADMATLAKRELAPFRAAVAARVDFLMTAHVLFTKVDPNNMATFSKKILTGLLRRKMGFKGLVVTDDLNMKAVGGGRKERIKRAIDAGADVLLIRDPDPVGFMQTFETLVAEGGVDADRIRESLARVKRVKRRLGRPPTPA